VIAGSEQAGRPGICQRLDFGGLNAIARSLVTGSLPCHGVRSPARSAGRLHRPDDAQAGPREAPAVAALLLSSDLRLLVRHAGNRQLGHPADDSLAIPGVAAHRRVSSLVGAQGFRVLGAE